MKYSRRNFLRHLGYSAAAMAGLSVPLFATGCLTNSNIKKPNILLIVADDMGWADIGYHNSEIKTPNLDRLAKEGVELDQHYVQPQCTPTRVSLMTGRYPNRFGKHCSKASNEQAFPFETVTLASALKSADYDTAISGKWHLGSLPDQGPKQFGFNFSHGSFAGAVGMYDHRYRLTSPKFSKTWHRNDEYVNEEGHATDVCSDQAIKWIQQLKNPFFLYLPFHSVHTPLVEPEKWLDLNNHISDPDRRLMAAALSHLDYSIGRIIQMLEETGQRENTLIVFFSDNGGIHTHYKGGNYPPPDPALKQGFSSNDPLRGGKVTVYEGGIRVPAFVNWQDRLKPKKVTAPMHANDWMPTLCNLAGYQPEQDLKWDGQDIWQFITGEKQTYDKPRFFYWHWNGDREKPGRIAIREGNWKMVIPQHGEPAELYNLANDPSEKNNLVDQSPKIIERLKLLLKKEMEKDR